MRHVLEGPATVDTLSWCALVGKTLHLPEVHSFIVAELSVCHVTMITNNLPHMFRRHVFLLCLHKTKLPFLGILLGSDLLPFPDCRMHNCKCKQQNSINVANLSPAVSPQREAGREGKDTAACAARVVLFQSWLGSSHLTVHTASTHSGRDTPGLRMVEHSKLARKAGLQFAHTLDKRPDRAHHVRARSG